MVEIAYRSEYYNTLGDDAENWSEYLAAREITDEETQRRFTGKCGVSAYDEAIETVDYFIGYGQRLGVNLKKSAKLLDFGCGWGRISKTATQYFEPDHITSVDVFSGALDLMRAAELPVTLVKAEPDPPLPLVSGTYDFIFAYSVFSHLKESKAQAWMQEFRRLLKPGGLVAVTTRPRGFINWVAKLREKDDIPAHARGSDIAFLDTEDCLRRYDAGEFVFDQERTNGPLNGVGYGEACIPSAYVQRMWGPEFAEVRFVPAHEAGTSQSNIFCVK